MRKNYLIFLSIIIISCTTSTNQRQTTDLQNVMTPSPTPVVQILEWNVIDTDSWIDTINEIRNSGNNKRHIINVTEHILIPTSPSNTFGNITGVNINIRGDGILSLSDGVSGNILFIGNRQTLVLENITIKGRIWSENGNLTIGANKAETKVIGGTVRINGGTFTMEGNSSISGSSGTGVFVRGGVFHMKDNATISNNNNGGVIIEGSMFTARSNFIMEGGMIVQNIKENSGGGVYFEGDTFTMRGGVIENNSSNREGGGVYIFANGTFNMYDGSIRNNYIENLNRDSNGGGVCVHPQASFIMHGGVISGNRATNGGGIYGGFTLVDGSINNNIADFGGGVYSFFIFRMQGGVISGNVANRWGGGVYLQFVDRFIKTGGIIYGANEENPELRNIASERGNAVNAGLNWRNVTAGVRTNTENYGFWLND